MADALSSRMDRASEMTQSAGFSEEAETQLRLFRGEMEARFLETGKLGEDSDWYAGWKEKLFKPGFQEPDIKEVGSHVLNEHYFRKGRGDLVSRRISEILSQA